MKRYEKMGLNTEEVLEIIEHGGDCETCIARLARTCFVEDGCSFSKAKALNQEIKTVPRIATINTVEELGKAREDYKDYCEKQYNCAKCKYDASGATASCFANYLAEEIETEATYERQSN